MDKEKAARTLAKELGDKLGRRLVGEESYKRSVIECASAKHQVSNPLLVSYEEGTFYAKKKDIKHSSNNLVDLLVSCGDDFKEANYYFSEAVPITSYGYTTRVSALFSVTPYALIGEAEKSALRRLFYKDAPLEVINSMNVLGIEHFVGLYEAYQNGKLYCLYMPATKLLEDIDFLKKFIEKASNFVYDKDGEVKKDEFDKFNGIDALNYMLKRLGVHAKIALHEVHTAFVHKNCISEVLDESSKTIERIKNQYYGTVSNEFIHFVFFSLPPEDQSIDANKEILKSSLNTNFIIDVLGKEYSENRHFCEYFDVLDKEVQDEVFKAVKDIPKRNAVCDSFLWSKGFKDLTLNHVEMYKKDAKGFLEYFPSRSIEEKKAILKDVMECESVNEEVIHWLNENCLDLVREVGFNG